MFFLVTHQSYLSEFMTLKLETLKMENPQISSIFISIGSSGFTNYSRRKICFHFIECMIKLLISGLPFTCLVIFSHRQKWHVKLINIFLCKYCCKPLFHCAQQPRVQNPAIIWPSSITLYLTSEKLVDLERCEKRGQKNKKGKITARGSSIETR